MEPGKWAQVLEMIESESRALNQAEAPSTPQSETDVEVAPLVQKLGTTSIAEVEKMIEELQEARDFLQAEGERVQREAEHYTTLTQMASASLKIISDTVAGWREAGHPLRNDWRSSQFDVRPSPTGQQRFGACAGSAISGGDTTEFKGVVARPPTMLASSRWL